MTVETLQKGNEINKDLEVLYKINAIINQHNARISTDKAYVDFRDLTDKTKTSIKTTIHDYVVKRIDELQKELESL